MTKVSVLGASGYSALELITILLRHPEAEIVGLTSRQKDCPHIESVHPSLVGRLDLTCAPFNADQIAEESDCVFSALPHGASMDSCAALLERGCRVVDFSADYRLADPNTYAEWYGASHSDLANLDKAVYGLPELFGDVIREAVLVANPGCFPTSAILGLAPLLVGELIRPTGIVVDSKTGVSGAGRNPSPKTHFPECNESISPYNVGKHRHTPEIDQVLSGLVNQDIAVLFTPHLAPMDRGILSTIYADPAREMNESQLKEVFEEFYAQAPFVRILDELPRTRDSAGTNFCDIAIRAVRNKVVVFSALDNLGKGAAGAAVQNFNLMYGLDETTALL